MRIQDEIITLNGHELLLRNAREEDAEMLIQYLKETTCETKFLVNEPEEITLTLEQERGFINSQNDSETNLMILGFLDGEFVGNCAFNGNSKSRYSHRASFAIALYQKFTGMGIGTAMAKRLLEIAEEKGLEQLELEVVTENQRAVALYEKLGFKICGTFPKNMKYKDGTYADVYLMVKEFEKGC